MKARNPTVRLHLLESASAAAAAWSAALAAAVARRPALVLLHGTGPSLRACFTVLASEGGDFSRLRLRTLDAWVAAPRRGFTPPDHPSVRERWLEEAFLAQLPPASRPRDVACLPEDLTTEEELEAALEAQPEAVLRPAHPLTGEACSELVFTPMVQGTLAVVRRYCHAFEELLEADPPDVVAAEALPSALPSLGLSHGPYTRPESVTHLAATDDAARTAAGPFFGSVEAVPGFALTCGPATVLRGGELWVTALGKDEGAAVAAALGDPRLSETQRPGSLALALRHAALRLFLDAAAAAELDADGGVEGLAARYREAGVRLHVSRG